MIKIRLKRFGKKRAASFRLVAVQSTSRRDGLPLEELGFYNAQPTDTVRRLLEKAKVFEQLSA
jgi:small subunit ribosomal protein S16